MVSIDVTEKKKKSVSSLKFLCSYGGGIFPRSTDGKLRYVGGHTRVLSVYRLISYEGSSPDLLIFNFNVVLKSNLIFRFRLSTELMKKLCELCGYSTVVLRCQLPNGDLETLISVKSEEDLLNIVQEYDRVSESKIRAVLSPPRSIREESPSSSSCSDRSPNSPFSATPSPPNSLSPTMYGRYMQSRYCLPHADLPMRFNHRSEESRCSLCRAHKESRVFWH
ncbi:unnamed protein product [Cochlearia groenlandica]